MDYWELMRFRKIPWSPSNFKGFARIPWISFVSAHFLQFVVFPHLHVGSLKFLRINETLKIPWETLHIHR